MEYLEIQFLVSAQFKFSKSHPHFLISSLNPNLVGVSWEVLKYSFVSASSECQSCSSKLIYWSGKCCLCCSSKGWLENRRHFLSTVWTWKFSFVPKWKGKRDISGFFLMIVTEGRLKGYWLRHSSAMRQVQFLSCLDRFKLDLHISHLNESLLCHQCQNDALKRLVKSYTDLLKNLWRNQFVPLSDL